MLHGGYGGGVLLGFLEELFWKQTPMIFHWSAMAWSRRGWIYLLSLVESSCPHDDVERAPSYMLEPPIVTPPPPALTHPFRGHVGMDGDFEPHTHSSEIYDYGLRHPQFFSSATLFSKYRILISCRRGEWKYSCFLVYYVLVIARYLARPQRLRWRKFVDRSNIQIKIRKIIYCDDQSSIYSN